MKIFNLGDLSPELTAELCEEKEMERIEKIFTLGDLSPELAAALQSEVGDGPESPNWGSLLGLYKAYGANSINTLLGQDFAYWLLSKELWDEIYSELK